jgi:hypothetical protein
VFGSAQPTSACPNPTGMFAARLFRLMEKYTGLLHFVQCQSAAAAQATALAFGAHHSAALLISEQDGRTGHHSLYTFGRGAHHLSMLHGQHWTPLPLLSGQCRLCDILIHDNDALHSYHAGFQGQLGHGDFGPQPEPKQLCLGYQTCSVHCSILNCAAANIVKSVITSQEGFPRSSSVSVRPGPLNTNPPPHTCRSNLAWRKRSRQQL